MACAEDRVASEREITMTIPMSKSLLAALMAAGSLTAQVPEIAYDSTPNLLKLPEHIYLGEAAGVATTSKGNILVYTRTGGVATAGRHVGFTRGGSRLSNSTPVESICARSDQGVYGFVFAQTVKVDPQDNIWVVDDGSNMVLKFDPAGRIVMTLRRKPESVNLPGGGGGARGVPGDNFVRPTDVAWDAAGNIFVADGGNSRIVKLDKSGTYVKAWGSKGTEPGQFSTPHSLAVDAQGNVYVADPGNKRIRFSMVTALSRISCRTSVHHGRSVFLQALTSSCSARIRTRLTPWTTAKSTRCSWTGRWLVSSARPANC